MSERPPDLIYALDERPPWIATFLLGLQHIFTMSSMLVLPVVIVQEVGGSFLEVSSVVSFSMIVAGMGTILQSLKKGPVGSGYLCPNLCGPSFLYVSLQAGWIGGLPLMHGMIMVAGLTEILFSRVVRYLKKLFPTEITGLVVLMVGFSLIPLGASKFLGVEFTGDRIEPVKIIVAILTLLVMTGITIWGKGKIKLYSVLIGIVIGYLLSVVTGLMSDSQLHELTNAPFLSYPGKGVKMFRYAFDPSLILPFALIAIVGSLKTFGNLTTCQKINDPQWKEVNIKNIGRGLLADGITVFAGGFLGGVATDTSASNVGLSAATKATSRVIAWSAGGMFILFGFMPKLAAIFTIMPQPVMGAIVVYVTCFMILSGIQIILTSKPDTRKIFIVGISLVFGLSVDIMPSLFISAPAVLQPLLSSSLTLSTILAVILNQLYNLRLRKQGNSNKLPDQK